VCEYLLDLRTFFRYLEATRLFIDIESDEFLEIDIKNIDLDYIKRIKTEKIYEFLMYTSQSRKNGWASRSRKLSSLKAFFKYLTAKKHLLDVNPTADISAPKKRASLPKHLTFEESVVLLESIKNDKESKTNKRDFAIVTLFLNCGMRLSELVNIDLTDISPDLRSLRVIGKGAKERIVYLNGACQRALIDYLRIRTSEDTSKLKTTALFLSNRQTRISNKTVQWLVYKYLKIAGLDNRGFSVHKLRHTAATLMYQTGNVDVRVLKDILGHEQLNTTQIYTHVSDGNMINAVDSNPLSNLKIKERKKETDDEEN
jgi:site-specific recombinase XerD